MYPVLGDAEAADLGTPPGEAWLWFARVMALAPWTSGKEKEAESEPQTPFHLPLRSWFYLLLCQSLHETSY